MSPSSIEFGCRPTAIGSMPHSNAEEACQLVLRYLPNIPAWPQLLRRSFKEGMVIQYSEGFPGMIVEADRAYVNIGDEFTSALEQLYARHYENDYQSYPISAEYAAGLHAFLTLARGTMQCAKGQIAGPISCGLSVANKEGLPIIYNEIAAEAMAKHLRLKAAWQERTLRDACSTTLIFVDEPSLSSLGTAGIALSTEHVVGLIEETLGGISGLKGVHCCGSADWSLLLKTSIDVLSFDAYNYAESLSLYPQEVKALLDKGGSIAWGIVPNDEDNLAKETVSSLKDRLEAAMAPFTKDGYSIRRIVDQGLLTPSCGLAYVSSEAAEHALQLLADLSAAVRKRHLP
jgi:methionine synthase II (cobalamin-independent)